MNRDERAQLLAEISTVRQMLAATPQEDVLERCSLESRLRAVERRLVAIDADTPPAGDGAP